MKRAPRKSACIALALTSLASLAACGGDYFRFYDVIRVPSEVCDLTPEGEFCGDEGLPPAEQEGWAIEREGTAVRIYIDEEVWPATQDEDDDTQLKAEVIETLTSEPGPCTTRRRRSVSLTATADALKGTLVHSTRITGGEDCGDSPRGGRVTYTLDGALLGTP